MRQSLQAGFLLHYQNYQESSLLIDVFTQREGRLSLIAKGVKQQKSPYLGLLRPFVPLNMTYSGSRNLKILTHVETGTAEFILPGINTYCGFYLNELIRYFIPVGEPYQDVFLNYLSCLQQLKTQHNIEAALRTFEIRLMHALGYGLGLEFDFATDRAIEADLIYRYDIEQGATIDSEGNIHGSTLIAMQQENYINQRQLNEAKWLMRQVIDFHLQGKTLKSRLVIAKLMQKELCNSN
ncbi:MAG: DNA repair protein RecO [Methyloprofundus sp.]|nr:DNA repair protein RecO [Methyloprofundus sp.]